MCPAQAPMPLPGEVGQEAHYLRTVTDFGEHRAVITTAPIYAANGIKLVDAGIRINGRLYARLAKHRLSNPIDEQLSVDGAIGSAALLERATTLIDERGFCARLAEALGGRETLLAPLGKVPLAPPVAFKLTLMRETQPDLFLHSIQMALVTIFLGHTQGRRGRGLTDLATAALLHDLGVLHIDPEILKPGHTMSPEERRHLFAHPLTTVLILKPHPVYGPEIARAIVEHHERLDGSGYPRGLGADAISADGKILLLAEVVSAMFEKNWDAPGLRLSLVLRLNHRKFDRALVSAITKLLKAETETIATTSPPEQEITRIENLGVLFTRWQALKAEHATDTPHPSVEFLDIRLARLERSMIEAGLDANTLSFVLAEPESDPEALSELMLLARESRWQIDHTIQETQRRWPLLTPEEAPATVAFCHEASCAQ